MLVFLSGFFLLELHEPSDVHIIHCAVDDLIPFNEWFVLPYFLWYAWVPVFMLYFITKLERNGMFVYESVPGTAVNHFQAGDTSVQFSVEGEKDAQITIQLEDEREYEVYVDGVSVGGMKTNVSGKLVLSVELNPGKATAIRIEAR